MAATAPANDAVSDFPILCEKCLGPNPYVRMTKEKHGRACKICERPYSLYRWRPGKEARFSQTEACQLCARLKNCCQTCLLDLQYGLPTHVRDSVLNDSEVMKLPQNECNREYMFRQLEDRDKAQESSSAVLALPYGKANPSSIMERVSRRKKPYVKFQSICKDFLAGNCERGKNCSYRHENPITDESSEHELDFAYRQSNAPRDGSGYRPPPDPPADTSITTIFVGGIDEQFTENDLRKVFSAFGSIASTRLIANKACAFIEMVERPAAEKAVSNLWGKLKIRQMPLRVAWARPRDGFAEPARQELPRLLNPNTEIQHEDAGKFLSIPPPPKAAAAVPPPPGMSAKMKPKYPSANPSRHANRILHQ